MALGSGDAGARPYRIPRWNLQERLSERGRSMKDPRVPRNGLCLLPSQHADNHISFKDPLRASAGEESHLSHLQSGILDAFAVFHVRVNEAEVEVSRRG